MKITSREMNRIAGIIDRVVGEVDIRSAEVETRHIVRDEAETVLALISTQTTKGAERLRTSLSRLVALMDSQEQVVTKAKSKSGVTLQTLLKAFAALAGGLMITTPAFAASVPSVNSTITHPTSSVQMTVVKVAGNAVLAEDAAGNEYMVYYPDSVGQTINLGDSSYQILGYETAAGRVSTYSLSNGYPVNGSQPITGVIYGTPAVPATNQEGTNGVPESIVGTQPTYTQLVVDVTPDYDITIPVGAGSSGQISNINKAKNGSNGRVGALLFPATDGKKGDNGGLASHSAPVNNNIVSTGQNSPGIIIASIGGDGGNGGGSYVSVWGGSDGARGGSGGRVDATLVGSGSVTTTQNNSHGVVLQSRAGRGGNGGVGWAAIGGGGGGGDAASGGSVEGVIDLTIDTAGTGAHGILAQSLGGGAGSGGASYGLWSTGGAGGWAGNGGSVEITNSGNITTRGNYSHGILAQSIGGVGGDGGAAGGVVALGGDGGGAGNGSSVIVRQNDGVITTLGNAAYGIIAQSIGGSGGNGGSSGGIVALGGSGSAGGNASTVNVTTNAGSAIRTSGTMSHGVVAQSIGGGGGNGGKAGGIVAIGGSGSGGGTGSAVTVNHGGALVTNGAGSYGILAQSIGGGGGVGGSTGGLVGLGGSGGSGNNAGNVRVDVNTGGSISTTGVVGRAIVAQSIGGGGGDGGTTGGLVALGGKGASGGNAGTVRVTNRGAIYTTGNAGDGIFAQSIGGGGGSGGSAYGFVGLGGSGSVGGNGNAVNIDNFASIITEGHYARGIFAQSIGGGGGSGGAGAGVFSQGGNGGQGGSAGTAAVPVTIGGSSSTASTGGGITLSNSGLISTKGNQSTAIFAQSIGGGGGDGGNANGVFMAIGGKGGAGGSGGSVNVTNTGTLLTTGNDAYGIFAQSVGGGGGNGGSTTAVGLLAAVAIGGNGGNGAKGGNVNLTFDSAFDEEQVIKTTGDRSVGAFAQSVGGGGGTGGYAVSQAIGVGGGASISLGGKGGTGGDGGTVSGTGYTNIWTDGEFSDGLVMQSIGGGGGNGGFAVAVNQAVGVASVSVGIGGEGSVGGTGGNVTYANGGGNILTEGDFSKGIVAQSIGGGGGNGGLSTSISTLVGIGASVSVGIGGNGGAGGRAGTVNFNFDGNIETHGLGSTGALMQAVGGGGGSGGAAITVAVGVGGAAAVNVGLGGSGAAGGDGGTVVGTIGGNITTFGDQSNAFVAQSIGGGGGSGGYTVNTGISGGLGGLSASIGIGGSGSAGGKGGNVTATVGGDIHTKGKQSGGMIAQSVGGGGGAGGFAVSAAVAGGLGAGSVAVALGGSGGAGGDAGVVIANANKDVTTEGDQSTAILAQSVGGGGGSGGFSVAGSVAGGLGAGAIAVGIGGSGAVGGDGSSVTVDVDGRVMTSGDQSSGVVAQSIGGGGGDGGFNVSGAIAGGLGAGTASVGLGGSGAGGGDAGRVTVYSADLIQTTGNQSSGLVAQSIGGGGGNGGFNVTAGIAGGIGAGSAAVGLGGSGSGGGRGGDVYADASGIIQTFGDESNAFVAQSIGGGGGNGGFNVTGAIGGGVNAGAVAVGLGGKGAGGGDGGNVTSFARDTIFTDGVGSYGMISQSIGGGGGAGGFNVSGAIAGGVNAGSVSVGLGGSGAGGGNAGTVTAYATDITTMQDNSTAFVAQAIGGAGGAGGYNVSAGISGGVNSGTMSIGLGGSGAGGGDGGDVFATIEGDIVTHGDFSEGILAQSVGGGGGNGGFNVSGGINGSGANGGAVVIGLGGSAGEGGVGKTVTLDMTGSTITKGDFANAVVVQSLGGGGGAGGFNVSGGISAAGANGGTVTVGLGGSGGKGGVSGDVRAEIVGAIQTSGQESRGLLAQSIGGGGGAGGFNVSGGITAAGSNGGALTVGLGGTAGGGGRAGNVTASIDGIEIDEQIVAVITEGDGAVGVTAQSVGGGGGAGGMNVSGGIAATGSNGGALTFGLGGFGGDGGDAGTVYAEVNGLVQTSGKDATGIIAQSVGGGGGAGAMNISGSVTAAGNNSGGVTLGVGGFGGAGGDASDVTGLVVANIVTLKDNSAGMIFQSLGGGGGAGGTNVTGGVNLAGSNGGQVSIGMGGFGSGGGDAGNVDVAHTGNIFTKGHDSFGALIQSLGGGGGAGGTNISGAVSASNNNGGSIGIGLGGFGGGGGDAGTVDAILRGNVTTLGDGAWGALLQSLGGSGGAGGTNVTASVSLSLSGNGGAIGLGMGGFGGGGGEGNDVTGTVVGDYYTEGKEAFGVAAQSLGGGGGAGGMNVSGALSFAQSNSVGVSLGLGGFGGDGGNAGDVNLTRTGDTETRGAGADGVLAQSIGGSGGAGGINISGSATFSSDGNAAAVSLGLGGFGGGGGHAGDVYAAVEGNVWAKGLENDFLETRINEEGETFTVRRREGGSNGVVAQSVGGGGGSGGINVSAGLSITPPESGSSRSLVAGVGGFGGGGGNAGEVELNVLSLGATRNQIQAIGDNRSAVIAQSIGGGGGNGGLNVSGGVSMDGQLTVGVGGFGGDGGYASDVNSAVTADIYAAGNLSRGLMIQSIGGGGGAGAVNISGGIQTNKNGKEPSVVFGLGGSGGAGGHSGDVTSFHEGNIFVEGVDSVGALVQSIAGGGGSGGLNVSVSGSMGDKQSYAVAAGIGGSGGVGDDAGDVNFTSIGNIYVGGVLKTDADNKTTVVAADHTGGGAGVLVQSIGGGGGVAGVNLTGAASRAGSPVALGIGGSGGTGGNAGSVDVTRGWDDVNGVETAAPNLIRTWGDSTSGLVAQSIGGGGGNAAANMVFAGKKEGQGDEGSEIAATFAVGGSGAGAGSGSTVSVRHNGTIWTSGEAALGIIAQSIGGGGGNAASNNTYGKVTDASMTFNAQIGGGAGAAGSGDNVRVDHVGDIVTEGRASTGILAQSIGGGGGNTDTDLESMDDTTLSVVIGRKGGSGGTAGKVTVLADGRIYTAGDTADGIVAQSIGGGGGKSSTSSLNFSKSSDDGPSNGVSLALGVEGGVGATADDVSVTFDGEIITTGEASRGIIAQSIGGGGGLAGSASASLSGNGLALALGGAGGQGAISGNVYVTNHGLIQTSGQMADGILAQAIGGGGGDAGSAEIEIGQDDDHDGSQLQTASIALGGSGGEGAIGGNVSVENYGRILTESIRANGIRAMSIGGGGGTGGSTSISAERTNTESQDIQFSLGGFGGDGATGGDVSVINTGLIYTQGDNASGISALSIGGGGGDAGLVRSASKNKSPGSENDSIVISIGGKGGTGAAGGDIVVRNLAIEGEEYSGTILTEGAHAYGIFAQSIGGGGGNGSTVVNTAKGTSGGGTQLGLSVGGWGGEGATGGTVTVENSGLIVTEGDFAHGILAQSIGGGGGNGGLSLTANAQLGTGGDAPSLAIGGFGGDGGNGSTVRVDNSGQIITRGKQAHGIVAQSIGGGGGNAGIGVAAGTDGGSMLLSGALNLLVGALGNGNGGLGGDVIVNHSGNITVLGEGSVAIKAESINGGGGNLMVDIDGLAAVFLSDDEGEPEGTANGPEDIYAEIRMGAEGATNMNANKVTVNTTGTFQTAGKRSVADFGQSLAGGGGTLDLRVRLTGEEQGTSSSGLLRKASISTRQQSLAMGFNAALGGTDGVDNAAADIANTQSGELLALGTMSTSILTQSIGGGGGRGVVNLIADEGSRIGVTSLSLGALNSTNETGGAIDRTQSGAVVAAGDYSFAAVLQSIGGGGGSMIAELNGQNDGVVARLGAAGGTGADARSIKGNFSGGTEALGLGASGMLMQSIGGGGGEIRLLGASSLDVTLGGSDGISGNASDITLTHTGSIVAHNTRGHGLVLQSIGGGGGAVFGQQTEGTVTLSSDNAGNGGAINFAQDGHIVVGGSDAYGIIAQSLGGGGGWVDGLFAGSAGGRGYAGAIDLDLGGVVYAVQENSVAVFAQSEGLLGAGDINITLQDTVRGGSGTGAGVRLSGGADNLLTNTTSLSSVNGWAVQGGAGNDRVVNAGLFYGNLDLAGGDNRFHNTSEASFLAFDTIRLRDGGLTGMGLGLRSTLSPMVVEPSRGVAYGEATFTNDGLFRMGLEGTDWPIDLFNGETFGNLDGLARAEDNVYYGARVITTVELDGHFVQTATGKSLFDVAFGKYDHDRVNLTGDAVIGGELGLNLIWLESAKPITLFATGGMGYVNSTYIAPTLALNFKVWGDSSGVHLGYDSNFGQRFMRPNEQLLGDHLDSALQVGDATGIGRLMTALGNMVAGQEDLYQSIFAELNPEGHVASMQTQYYGAGSFARQMFDCDLTKGTEEMCVWGRGSTSVFDQDATSDYWGVTSRIFNARFGIQRRLDANWVMAASVGYNSLARQPLGNGRMNTQGDGFDLGLGARRTWAGGSDLSLMASAGWQWLESQRYGYVFDAMVGKSNGENGYAQLGFEAGHTIDKGSFYLRPALNVQATALRNGSYEESGWAGLGARVGSDTQWISAIEPKATMGWNFDPVAGVNTTFAMTAGRVHRSDDSIYLPIQMIGSQQASDPALIATPLDTSAWRVGLETKIVTDQGVTFQAGYEGQLGDKAEVHTGSVSIRWNF